MEPVLQGQAETAQDVDPEAAWGEIEWEVQPVLVQVVFAGALSAEQKYRTSPDSHAQL